MTGIDIEPFRYESTPVPESDQGASGGQINDQHLEDYLNRLLEALNSLEARVAALEAAP